VVAPQLRAVIHPPKSASQTSCPSVNFPHRQNFLKKTLEANSGLTPSTGVPYLFKISLNIGRAEGNAMPVVTLDHQGKPISVKTLKEPRWGDIQILDYKAPNDA
jgi:hypothetical protein